MKWKELLFTTTAKQSQIYANAISGLNEENRANVGFKDHVLRNLRNQRRKNIPAEPVNTDFDIPEAWKTRENNENIIIYDNGRNAINRVIVFSSVSQLQQMGRNNR